MAAPDTYSEGEDFYLLDGFPFYRLLCPEQHVRSMKEFPLYKDDVIVTGFPKSGNHWVATIVCAIQQAADLDKFAKDGPGNHTTMLENATTLYLIRNIPRPTAFFTHAPYHMLPKGVAEKQNKVIYISRNPKDILVSFYHFYQLLTHSKKYSWDDLFVSFVSGGKFSLNTWMYTLKAWYQHKGELNILFIKYEDMKENLEAEISCIAKFLSANLTTDQIKRIASLVSVKSMQENEKLDVHMPAYVDSSKGRFIRKGEVGDWKNQFTDEQNKAFDQVYVTFLSDPGVRHRFEL